MSTNSAQPRSWIVRDNDDKPWGPFETAKAARTWAEEKWPGVPSYDENDGGGYWDIEALWPPT